MATNSPRIAFELQVLGHSKVSKELKKLYEDFKELESGFKKINPASKKSSRELKKLSRDFSRAGNSSLDFRGDLDRSNRSLKKAERSVNKLKKSLGGLDSSYKKAGKSSRGFNPKSFGGGLKSAGTALSLGVTLPSVIAGVSGFGVASGFEAEMNKVRVLTNNVGFEHLEKKALDLGATTAFGAGDAAKAMSFLGMAGLKTGEILGSMTETLELASAGGVDLATSADVVTNIMSGYGIGIDEISSATDSLTAAFTSSNTTLMSLSASLVKAGPIASSLNMKFNETLAIIGGLGNVGYKAEEAGTALKIGLSRLIKPTKEMTDSFKELGISRDQFLDKNGKISSLKNVLGILEKSGADVKDYLRIFGEEAGPAFTALKNLGVDAIDTIEKKIDNSLGRRKKIADAMTSGARGALNSLKSAFEGFQIAVFKSGLLEWATDLLNGFAKIVRKMTRLKPSILKFFSIFLIGASLLGPLLFILGQITISIGAMVFAFKILTPWVWKALAPFLIFPMKIAAIAYGLWFLWKNWKKIFLMIADITVKIFKDISTTWTNTINSLYDPLRKFLQKTFGIFSKTFGDNFPLISALKDASKMLPFELLSHEEKEISFKFNPLDDLGLTNFFEDEKKLLSDFKDPFLNDKSIPSISDMKNLIPDPMSLTNAKAMKEASVIGKTVEPLVISDERNVFSTRREEKGLWDKFLDLLSFNDGKLTHAKKTLDRFHIPSFDDEKNTALTQKPKEKIEIIVDFKNIPKGANVDVVNNTGYSLELNQGYAMEFG